VEIVAKLVYHSKPLEVWSQLSLVSRSVVCFTEMDRGVVGKVDWPSRTSMWVLEPCNIKYIAMTW